MWVKIALLAAILSTLAGAAVVAEPAPPCPVQIAPSGELAPWATPIPGRAAARSGHLSEAVLTVGRAALLTLPTTPSVRYPFAPAKPTGADTFGGLVRLDVREAATYRVALGSAAWIDLVRNGTAAASIAHGHGPDCTGIHKIVDFALTPGRYTLQIEGNKDPQATVLVIRLR